MSCCPTCFAMVLFLVGPYYKINRRGLSQFQNGPVGDGHHFPACLIPVDYQISWDVVLRRYRRYRNLPLAPPNLGGNLLAVFVAFRITKPMRCMNDFAQALPSSPVAFCVPRAAARAMALLKTPQHLCQMRL